MKVIKRRVLFLLVCLVIAGCAHNLSTYNVAPDNQPLQLKGNAKSDRHLSYSSSVLNLDEHFICRVEIYAQDEKVDDTTTTVRLTTNNDGTFSGNIYMSEETFYMPFDQVNIKVCEHSKNESDWYIFRLDYNKLHINTWQMWMSV